VDFEGGIVLGHGALRPYCGPSRPSVSSAFVVLLAEECGASSRDRTGTPCSRAADFKSAVSTDFTIEAGAPTVRQTKREALSDFPLKLERETSLELATSTLARLRSTN
jgi:hypothetical protein